MNEDEIDVIVRRLNGDTTYRNRVRFPLCRELRLDNKRIQKIQANIFTGFDKLKKLHLENNEIKTIENGAFDNLVNLEYLALHQDCLQQIDSNLCRNLEKLRILYFSLNKITTIEANAFNRLTNLEVLYLNNNYLIDFPQNIFNPLVNLKNLKLSGNYIAELRTDLFSELHNLEELFLPHNKIIKIQNNCFNGLKKLKVLNLNDNKLQMLEYSMFQGLSSLEELWINNNYLTDLPQNIFNPLVNLKNLKLSLNYIAELRSDLFSELHNLEELFLPHNKIKKIQNNCFNGLKKLRVLNLNDNKLEALEYSMFQGLFNLKELWANSNIIERIEINSFQDLKRLKLLNLRGNLLNCINDRTFENQEMLEKIYLNHNNLNNLDSNLLLSNLKSLKNIDLSFNQIENVNPNFFNGLHRLKSICLYHNKLSFIGFNENLQSIKEIQLDNCRIIDFDISRLTNLEKLVMYNNLITKLEKKHFQNLKRLNYLYLFGNQIENIDENSFEDLESLKELVLSSNKLNSLTRNMFKWLKSLEKLYLFNNDLSELRSNEFDGLTNLQCLYLFGNKIEKIDKNAFNDLKKLKILILNNNLIKNTEWLTCKSLNALETLDLSSNKITALGKNCLNSLVNLNLFNNEIKELNEEFFERFNNLKLLYLENNLIESIYFFTYIRRYCEGINKIYLKNNRMRNISQEEYDLLMMILNNDKFSEISLDHFNLNHSKIIMANDDEIMRINKFNIENSKIYFMGGISDPGYSYVANSFFEYFQYLSNTKSIRFTDLKNKLRMLSIITGDQSERKTEFLKLIQNQNQRENFIILKYENRMGQFEKDKIIIDSKTSSIFQIISEENLKAYAKALSISINSETNSFVKNNIGQELGHTAEFKHILERDMHSFEFSKSMKEKEIKCLIEKISRNNFRTINELKPFLKRQILKKIYFNDLNVLINLDIKYDQEIESINKYLIDNNFKYSIIKPKNDKINENDLENEIKLHKIELMNLESKYRLKLEKLNKTDFLRLFLLLLTRDQDLVKVNMENFYQILLIDELDYLCDNKKFIFDEVITYINNLVNYMNIQVVATVSNSEILEFNDECVLELYETDKIMHKLSLRKFENILNQGLKKQIDLLNERKKVIYESMYHQVHNLTDENSFLKKEIDKLKDENNQQKNKILFLSEDNYQLKNLIENEEKQPVKQSVIRHEVIETKIEEDSSKFSTDVLEYLSLLNNNVIKREDDDLFSEFIKSLEQERNTINGIAKDIICGSIKNLAANLYSSSTHYLHEILQNFEDTRYLNKPLIKIYFDKTCIIFANNEIGFTPNDVISLCSLSVSQKLSGTHIGNKGIGFKSSFLCTNNPIIISKPAWKFQFILNENNMLSYITPRLIHDDDLSDVLKTYLENNKSLTTFMCFKFKEYYTDQYFKNLLDIIDINILLFTNNIDELIIEDEITRENFVLKRQWKIEKEKFGDNIQVINVALFKNENNCGNYRVFKKIGAKKSDEIVFAFPLETRMKNNFSLYSTFPINIDLKLNFLISSNWNLATNRESVNEYDRDNLLLRKKIFEMFNYIIQNDNFVSSNLMNYLPVFNSNASIWWQSFLNELVKIIKPLMEDNFSNIKISNENIIKLADRNTFMRINIEVIDKHENENLDIYGIKELSIKDLIKLLQTNDCQISEWYKLKDEEWFENLFSLLKFYSSIELKYDLLSTKIFLIDSNRQNIEHSDINKIFLFNPQKPYFKSICVQHNITLLGYLSISEKRFLTDFLGVSEINEDNLFKVILDDHINMNFSKETLFNDMDFIKQNFQLFIEYISLREEEFALCVPVLEKEFSLIEESTISTLFALDFSSSPGIPFVEDKLHYNFIDYPKATIKQCLEYEFFYLSLMQNTKLKRKLKLPDVNIQLLKGKIILQDSKLPLLDILSNPSIEINDVTIAKKIFEMLPEEFIKNIVNSLPIKTNKDYIFPISDVNLSTSESDLKRINVSNHELAMFFGIKKEEIIEKSTFESTLEIDLTEEPNNINLKGDIEDKVSYDKRLIKIHHQFKDNNLKQLREAYIERIKSHESFQQAAQDEERKELNKIFNFERNLDIGIKAEFFFFLYLQSKFNESLNIEECWISSLRNYVHKNDNKNCDDSAGYDFKIVDNRNLFSQSNEKNVCYIEVKGFSDEWEEFFILSKNEFNKANTLCSNEIYIIIIIENVSSTKNIQIKKIIDWTLDKQSIDCVESESFKFKFNQ